MRRLLLAALLALAVSTAAPVASAQEETVDLRLRLDQQEDAHAGDTVGMGFNVTNLGEGTATGVVVTIHVPEGATFVDGHQCTTTDGQTATCVGEDLPPNSFIGYSFSVRFDQEGTFNVTADVSSDQTDANPGDNHAEISVVVGEARENPPVNDVSCDARSDGVLVSWGVHDFVIEYRVYRAEGAGEATLLHAGVENEFLDTTAEAGRVYTYHVTAVRSNGESEPGAPCISTAIPEFPAWGFAAAAGVVGLGAYVALRRRG
ncbi:MAG TPA: hypothetical protein VHH36_00355 [Candidatus Thermoplasmatota archaeon]|nr:hypothetical protein [Candidatus Thermoplasmatota archaeon]